MGKAAEVAQLLIDANREYEAALRELCRQAELVTWRLADDDSGALEEAIGRARRVLKENEEP